MALRYSSVSCILFLMSGTIQFISSEIIINETLLSWEPSEIMKKNFPYYLSGYDYDDRPVFVWEWGKWNIRKVVEEGGEVLATYKRYSAQFIERLVKAGITPSGETGAVGFVVILDADGFTVDQLAHVPTLQFMFQEALYMNRIEPAAHKIIMINGNFAMETLSNLMKGIGGRVYEKMEVYGSNKARWIPALLQAVPKDQLPPWYGGNKSYKPVEVFG